MTNAGAQCAATHSCQSYGVGTINGLLKIIGVQDIVSFIYRALAQKRPILLRSLLIVATP